MEIPFTYGKIVKGKDYTDRKEDIIHLYNNFIALNNTVIISPRRWGKSSLVNKAIELLQQEQDNYIVVCLDAFNLKTSDSFLEAYAKSITSAFTSNDDLISFLKEALPKINVELTLGTGPISLSLHMERKETQNSINDIINLPQKLAEKKNKNVIVCIDEFQVIAEYNESLAFQRVLRAGWQTQNNVAFCLYGSKFNMMTKLIAEPKMPLYKFGDVFYLKKIDSKSWAEYITGRFKQTGKEIDSETAEYLANKVKNNSYYVQQLAQLTWLLTKNKCEKQIVDTAFNNLLEQMEMFFILTMEDLKPTQVEYLRAVCDEITEWNSTKTLSNYKMGTAPNVKNIKNILEKKEIITAFPNKIELQDPVFEYWLKNIYYI